MMSDTSQHKRAKQFQALHGDSGCFIMPNAWDAGSAAILSAAGFKAIATTSAGIAFSLAKPDYVNALSREENMAAINAICSATDVPVSADTENGYGETVNDVMTTVSLTIATGAVGGSIEDYTGVPERGLFDIEQAAERVSAARAAGDASGLPFTLTARAECFLFDHPDPLNESIRRLNRYREAGADCLYAPGPVDAETIATLVKEVDGPINVVAGLSPASLSASALANLGVRRISTGGALARAALAVVRNAGQEMMQHGTFSFAGKAIADSELSEMFAGN